MNSELFAKYQFGAIRTVDMGVWLAIVITH